MSRRYFQVTGVEGAPAEVPSNAFRWLILGLVLLSVSLPAVAQTPDVIGSGSAVESAPGSSPSSASPGNVQATAPVVVDGRWAGARRNPPDSGTMVRFYAGLRVAYPRIIVPPRVGVRASLSHDLLWDSGLSNGSGTTRTYTILVGLSRSFAWENRR